MKPAAFEYQSAQSAEHAIQLLIEGGEDARLLAGGQSLVAMMNFRIARPTVLIDLSRCNDLDYVRLEGESLCIGAMTRQRIAQEHVLISKHCPLLSLILSHAGPATIRNRGTVGGSIANGYPVAHLPAAAVCLSAIFIVQGVKGRRHASAANFFLNAMSTDLAPGEILRECRFPLMDISDRYFFREIANHIGGSAVCLVVMRAKYDKIGRTKSIDTVVSGFTGTPLRLANFESIVPDALNVDEMREAIDSDFHAAIPPDKRDDHSTYVADVCRTMVIQGISLLHHNKRLRYE